MAWKLRVPVLLACLAACSSPTAPAEYTALDASAAAFAGNYTLQIEVSDLCMLPADADRVRRYAVTVEHARMRESGSPIDEAISRLYGSPMHMRIKDGALAGRLIAEVWPPSNGRFHFKWNMWCGGECDNGEDLPGGQRLHVWGESVANVDGPLIQGRMNGGTTVEEGASRRWCTPVSHRFVLTRE